MALLCNPGHPWSCESSGVITTFVSFFQIFQQQRHLVSFFTSPKMKPKINIIDLRLLERYLSAVVFRIIKIASYYIIFWWKYGKSRGKIWHSDSDSAQHTVSRREGVFQSIFMCSLSPLVHVSHTDSIFFFRLSRHCLQVWQFSPNQNS